MKKLTLLFLLTVTSNANANAPGGAPVFHGNEPVNVAGFGQMFIGLLFVLAIIAAVVFFIRRIGSFTHLKQNHIRVLSGITVGQRERIMLLQVSDQQLLVGIAPGSIRTLHILDKHVTDEPASPLNTNAFAEKLHAILKQKNNEKKS